MFKWQRKNSTIIELTGVGIVGVPNKKPGFLKLPSVLPSSDSRAQFEIPYAAITSVQIYPHPAQLGLMDVLYIQSSEQGGNIEKSICSYSKNIGRAYDVVTRFRPDLLAK
jgi:hypothetical protein